jgi:hypothetical protein
MRNEIDRQPISAGSARPEQPEDPTLSQAKRELDRLQRQLGETKPSGSLQQEGSGLSGTAPGSGDVRLLMGGSISQEQYERTKRALVNP